MRILKFSVSVIILTCSFTLAQESGAPTASSDGKPAPAKVYVYRYKQFIGAALEPQVYCDEAPLARMDNGRYFIALIPPGKHTFRSNDKQSGLDWDLKAGQEYFMRVETATVMMKGHGRLIVVPREQASYELRSKKLKPLDSGKVIDKARVSVEQMNLVEAAPVPAVAAAPIQSPAPKLMPASATDNTLQGVPINGAGVVGTNSVSGEQISLGEAARRNKKPPQPTR